MNGLLDFIFNNILLRSLESTSILNKFIPRSLESTSILNNFLPRPLESALSALMQLLSHLLVSGEAVPDHLEGFSCSIGGSCEGVPVLGRETSH